MSKLSESDISTITTEYRNGKSQYALAKKFRVTNMTIRYHLINNGVSLRTGNQNQKYRANYNYFEKIDSHEKAYWLGFIAADGTISSSNKGHYLSIGLAKKDLRHLNAFKQSIQFTGKTFTYDAQLNGKLYGVCKITIHSKKLITDLANLSIAPHKTKSLTFSPMQPKFVNSYILGLIDGDGCWTVSTKDGQARLNLISSKHIIEHTAKTLSAQCQVPLCKIRPEKRSRGMFYLDYGGNKQISRIANYLYRNSPIFLERKMEKIVHLISPSPTNKYR